MTSELSVEDCALQRHLDEQVAIHVGVEGGIVLDQVAAGLDGDGLAGAGDLENQLEVGSHRRANLDILAQRSKAIGGDADPVGVEGDVGEDELAGGVGGRGPVESADCVGEMNRRVGNDGAGGIGDGAAHGAGVAALRGRGERRKRSGREGEECEERCAAMERHRKSPE